MSRRYIQNARGEFRGSLPDLNTYEPRSAPLPSVSMKPNKEPVGGERYVKVSLDFADGFVWTDEKPGMLGDGQLVKLACADGEEPVRVRAYSATGEQYVMSVDTLRRLDGPLEPSRVYFREMFCAACQENVDTVLDEDEEEFCSECGEDSSQLFDSHAEWREAARYDAAVLYAEWRDGRD